MKLMTIILASLFLLASAYPCAAQFGSTPGALAQGGSVGSGNVPNKPPPSINLPDLIVYWSLVGNPDSNNGKFEIRIKNLGKANADWSYAILKITHIASPGARPVVKSYHVKVPAIGAGQQADVVIETHLKLTYDSSCVTIDGTKRVTESNESNNENCGVVKS